MNEKLNIQHLTDQLVQKQGLTPKDAEKFVRTFFSLIAEGLEQDRYVKIRKWGTFKLIDVDSRESVNVNNGERIEIQRHTKISFTPDSSLKELINRPFAHFETVILNENTVLDDTLPEIEEEESIPENDIRKEEALITKNELLADNDVTENEAPFPALKNNSMKYFITLAVLITFVCAGAVFFIYNPDFFARPVPPPEEPKHITINLQQKHLIDTTSNAIVKTDSTYEDSVQKVQKIELTHVEKNVPQPSQTFVADTSSYEIIGTETTHILAEGETLTRVALKYYGTKSLWPYLVKHNPKAIKNPDNVPYGTIIKIPKLSKKK